MAWGLHVRKYIVENCRTYIVMTVMKMYTGNKTVQSERIKEIERVTEF